MCRPPVEARLTLRAVADMLGLTVRALRARIGRQLRHSPRARALRGDGIQFVKAGNRWVADVWPPWVENGTPRRWCSLEEAARTIGENAGTLRRRLGRHASRARGVRVARLKGWVACKIGDTWRLSPDATEQSRG
jgi:hypothetical protein